MSLTGQNAVIFSIPCESLSVVVHSASIGWNLTQSLGFKSFSTANKFNFSTSHGRSVPPSCLSLIFMYEPQRQRDKIDPKTEYLDIVFSMTDVNQVLCDVVE